MVYTGDDEAPFIANVSVKDGHFVAVDRDALNPPAAREAIDGEGLFMTPGLWDMHAHVANAESQNLDVQQFPAFGVTSIRDLGGYTDLLRKRIADIDAGMVIGPKIWYVGPTLNGEAFAGFHRIVASADDVTDAVDDAIGNGASMIKIHRAFRPELLALLIDAAHRRGLKVTGHIPLGISPLAACELGMDGIEHIASFIESWLSVAAEDQRDSAQAIAYLLSDDSTELYECLAEGNVAVTPTLVVYPAVARSRLGDQAVPPEYVAFMDGVKAITSRLYRSGVTLLAGSDTAAGGPLDIPPGSSLLDELVLLQESGISPRELIRAATSNPARALGAYAMRGSIAPGKIADFVLLDDDPGFDVASYRRVRAVYLSGRRVER